MPIPIPPAATIAPNPAKVQALALALMIRAFALIWALRTLIRSRIMSAVSRLGGMLATCMLASPIIIMLVSGRLRGGIVGILHGFLDVAAQYVARVVRDFDRLRLDPDNSGARDRS